MMYTCTVQSWTCIVVLSAAKFVRMHSPTVDYIGVSRFHIYMYLSSIQCIITQFLCRGFALQCSSVDCDNKPTQLYLTYTMSCVSVCTQCRERVNLHCSKNGIVLVHYLQQVFKSVLSHVCVQTYVYGS